MPCEVQYGAEGPATETFRSFQVNLPGSTGVWRSGLDAEWPRRQNDGPGFPRS